MQRHKFQRIAYVALTIVLLSLTLAPTAWAVEYKVLYKFQGGADGEYPCASLIFDAVGNLYGTTYSGGDYLWGGTVFKLTPSPDGAWRNSIIHSFGSAGDGIGPCSSLIFDSAGNLYGTTWHGGGMCNCGAVFKLTPNPDGSWNESIIHSFSGTDGQEPWDSLILDGAGNLYGTTQKGGDPNYCGMGCGVVFKLTPNPNGSWTETVIYNFSGADGRYPSAGLIFDAAGNLYGTTVYGGPYDGGTAFKLTPNPDGSWTRSKLHTFKGPDGALPYAGLIFDAAGNLYGTTEQGGAYSAGTVFKLTPNPDGIWTRSKLHTFKGRGGVYPRAGLILDAAGTLYGTTYYGGAYGAGTVFKLAPQPDGHWTFTKLHEFNRHHPYAGVMMDAAGNLYGTTPRGGNAHGLVFRITP